jgi:hypothetical protein
MEQPDLQAHKDPQVSLAIQAPQAHQVSSVQLDHKAHKDLQVPLDWVAQDHKDLQAHKDQLDLKVLLDWVAQDHKDHKDPQVPQVPVA